jgi:hypothetical protein
MGDLVLQKYCPTNCAEELGNTQEFPSKPPFVPRPNARYICMKYRGRLHTKGVSKYLTILKLILRESCRRM